MSTAVTTRTGRQAQQRQAAAPAKQTGQAVAHPQQPRSLLREIAEQYGMEPQAFAATLKATVVPADVSNEQFAAFLLVAKRYGLNPLTKEIYAFPTKGGGIQPIVSVDGWLKMINSHPEFDGMKFEDHADADGNIVAITCRIFRKDRSHPTEVTEYLAECQGALKDKWGNPTPWAKWPRRMLRHKATIQAARYAFGFSGVQDEDEFERTESVTPPPPPPPPSAPKGNGAGPAKVMEAEVMPPAPEPQQPSPEEELQTLEQTLQQCKTVQCLERVWQRAEAQMARWPEEYRAQAREAYEVMQAEVSSAQTAGAAPIVEQIRKALDACATADDVEAVKASWAQQHAHQAPPEVAAEVEKAIKDKMAELAGGGDEK